MNRFDDSDSLLDDFTKRHDILLTDLVRHEIPAIYWTVHTKNVVDSALNSRAEALIAEPTWGLLRVMLDRTFEHAEASIIAFITGSPASAVVIARTVMESAINVMCIFEGDRIERLFQYFSHYINHERKELERWKNILIKMDEKEAVIHRQHINKKKQVLDKLDEFVSNAKNQIGIKNNCGKWHDTIADRFRLLGFETSYRTVYAAMSSQTHNDAEDLLNYFIFVSSGNKELLERGGIEAVNFSRLLMYEGVRYYLEALHRYVICFDLDDAKPILIKGKYAVDDILYKIALEITDV
jgi:hypothetical protein